MSLCLKKTPGSWGSSPGVFCFLLKETPSSTIVLFTPNLGKDSHFEEYFSDGLENHQPVLFIFKDTPFFDF